jgi:2,4-dienoyl-CoA reductase-like NADH-dependent reductase (Old Yellow Enzyme family)
VSAVPSFDHVLRPGRIGPIELRNRIVLPAMDMNLCDHGMITDGEIAHYERRAAGGAALVITGSGAVAYPVGAASRHQPGLSDDRFVPGLTRLADAVHRAGSLLCIQLTHHGKTARVDMADGRPLLVPSVPEERLDLSALRDNTAEELAGLAAATEGKGPTYRQADEDDLAWVIDAFAAAARRSVAAGADAVEIHAAHGYIISTFLAAADNRRDDRWGGSLDNRARLGVEVIEAVRSAVGPGVAVLVRLSGQEFGGPGALTTDEAVGAASGSSRPGRMPSTSPAGAGTPSPTSPTAPCPTRWGRTGAMPAPCGPPCRSRWSPSAGSSPRWPRRCSPTATATSWPWAASSSPIPTSP